MDLFRYFYPHHNPRLRNTALRLQELAELEQAAVELKRAVERAGIRAGESSAGGIRAEHFHEIGSALDYVLESLSILRSAHPGDSIEEVAKMVQERENCPGWEAWARIARQKLLETPPLSKIA